MTPIEKMIHGLRVKKGQKKATLKRLEKSPQRHELYKKQLLGEISFIEQKIETFIKIKSTYEKNSSKN